ncbi:hypothetical protein [Legionella clemsonensis]|uniref:Secreted protein n=1 Tax=Legionella clemsonensis TaxID=1867846 RepID=A0A222P5B7_9GAMM|nr:hypothetical protein [Legionella clemsonensis]ASQ46975.1 hypothetical protein clem_12195 [Legionella clemsonensis]
MKNLSSILNKKGLMIFSLINLACSPLVAHTQLQGHQYHQPSQSMSQPLPTVQFTIEKIVDKSNGKLVFFKLTDSKTHQPLSLSDLKEVHTQKIHLLIIDSTLSDYSHVHPTPTKEPGIYSFQWQPVHQNTTYRAWADLVPVKTGHQEYVTVDLLSGKDKIKMLAQPASESTIHGYQFKLSFDAPLQVGKPTMGKIIITDKRGNPVKNLEPIMGAFAHIVGFNQDLKTVVHIHPMGQEPDSKRDRGGPELQFHIQPEKAGYIKVFAQVKVNGKELYAPFGVVVNN